MREPHSNNSFGEKQREPGAEGGREGGTGVVVAAAAAAAVAVRDQAGTERNVRGCCVCA